MSKSLGDRIRELRNKKDISLREFAKKLEHSAAHISDIELGRRHPSESLLEKIAALLGEPLEKLRAYDSRVPIEELKKLTELEPAFGFALRKLAHKKISADDILRFASKKPPREAEP
jgi:transcriptional regulator with XRE-family HTH domain